MTGHAARELFLRTWGYPPAGSWSAPGRVNLIGEHTDYTGGLVLPFALAERAHVAAAPRRDRTLRMVCARGTAEVSLDEIGPSCPPGWPAYLAGAPWVLQAAGHAVRGADLALVSSVPAGAGVSSSAALMSAALLAVADLEATPLDRPTLAALGRRAENVVAAVPCGAMDHTASLCCVAGHALLLDTSTSTLRQLPLDPEGAGLALLLLDTGVPHALTDGRYAQVRATVERACEDSREPDDATRRAARHIASENARVRRVADLLVEDRLAEIGPMLNASHASLRDDLRVSTPELDAVAAAAVAGGALGARMTGAGFGGSVIALAPRTDVRGVLAAVRRTAGELPGLTCREVTPSAGAARDLD